MNLDQLLQRQSAQCVSTALGLTGARPPIDRIINPQVHLRNPERNISALLNELFACRDINAIVVNGLPFHGQLTVAHTDAATAAGCQIVEMFMNDEPVAEQRIELTGYNKACLATVFGDAEVVFDIQADNLFEIFDALKIFHIS